MFQKNWDDLVLARQMERLMARKMVLQENIKIATRKLADYEAELTKVRELIRENVHQQENLRNDV